MKKRLVVFGLLLLMLLMSFALASCGDKECEHVAGETKRENVVEGTCSEKSTYEEVTYCKLCNQEIPGSRKKREGGFGDHVPAEHPVMEAVDIFDCTIGGVCEEVVYCSVEGCGVELSRKEVTIAAEDAHINTYTYIEDGFDCSKGGFKYEIEACSDCGKILSRTPIRASIADHSFSKKDICTVCGAVKGSSNLEYKNDVITKTCTVVSIGKATDDANIFIGINPDNGYPVTAIAEGAFANANKMVRVRIGGSVKSIGAGAFAGCTSLKNVYIYDLGSWCEIEFGDDLANPASIATSFYVEDVLTTKIVVPEKTRKIGSYAFCGSKLESVHIPDSVTTIGEGAFMGSANLRNVHIEGGVNSVGKNAFAGCEKLSRVYIDDLAAWATTEFKSNLSNPIYYAGRLYVDYELVEELVIPDGVTAIAPKAFIGITANSVTIPASVKSIGESAFAIARNLSKATIADGVEVIGDYAFADSAIAKIDLTESLEKIGASAFARCKNLTELKLPKNVTSIGNSAFTGCSGIASVTLSDSLLTIGNSAFENCTAITGIDVTENVVSIGDRAFANCKKLAKVTINANLRSVGAEAFAFSAVEELVFSNNVTKIGTSAFKACNNLSSLTVPFIGAERGDVNTAYFGYFFGAASALENNSFVPHSLNFVNVGDTTYIGEKAFYGCLSIADIYLCENIAEIGAYAFEGCTGLEGVYIPNVLNWSQIDFGNYTSNPIANAGKLYTYEIIVEKVDGKDVKTLKTFLVTEITELQLGNAITEISSYAFYGLNSLVKLSVPASVTTIGRDAFASCSELSEVSLGANITKIGARAFDKCEAIALLEIADIAKWCAVDFADYASNPIYYADEFKVAGATVSALVIPDSITEIGARAFMNYSGFASVKLGANVEKIGESAFEDCDGIGALTLTAKVKQIGDSAFAGCEKLAALDLGSVEIIGNKAFKGCKAIVKIAIVDTVSSIGHEAFSGCSAASELTIGKAVKTIGNSAFYGCAAVKSVIIPESVEFIGAYAFANCDLLASATFANVSGWIANGKAVAAFSDAASAAEILSETLTAYSGSR